MAKTMKDAVKSAENRKDKLVSLANELDDINKAILEAGSASASAVKEGNADEYQRQKEAIQVLNERKQYVTERLEAVRTSPAVSNDLARDIWKSYSDSYNHRMAEHMDKFANLKEALLNEYKEMVSMQADMLKTRTELGGYMNLGKDLIPLKFQASTLPCRTHLDTKHGLLSLGGTGLKDPDALYYLSSCALKSTREDIYNDPQFQLVASVVGAQLPYVL